MGNRKRTGYDDDRANDVLEIDAKGMSQMAGCGIVCQLLSM